MTYLSELQYSINYVSSTRFLDHHLPQPKNFLRQQETWKPCHDGITPSKRKGYALDFSLGKALHQCLGTRKVGTRKSVESNLLERCSIGPKAWRIIESGEGFPLQKRYFRGFCNDVFLGVSGWGNTNVSPEQDVDPTLQDSPEFAEICNFWLETSPDCDDFTDFKQLDGHYSWIYWTATLVVE